MLRVAVDVGPVHGHRSGVGNAVVWLLDALEDRDDLDLVPYVTSARARVQPLQRRLPVPATVAHRWWARSSQPPMDRWLGAPDVVHGTNYVVPPARCPRLVSVYDCWFLAHPDRVGTDVRRAGEALRRAVGDGAHVVASSEATASRVRSLLGTGRVRVIHLGPPPAHTCRADAPVPAVVAQLADRRFVLALGTIERRKNIPLLVSAFDRLARELPDVSLVLAGAEGDDTDELGARIRRLDRGVADRVVSLGTVDAGSKAWLLDSAAVLAYPSLDEGFGFPVLEAQQAGTPVVGSSAGSIPEIAGNGALFSQPDDAEALAANLHWVLTSDDVRHRLVARGNANVTRFSWPATAAAHAELYHELAEDR